MASLSVFRTATQPFITRAVSRGGPVAVRASPISARSPPTWRAGARRSFTSRSALLEKKYTEDHEWVELDADGKTGTIGITSYASKSLGDVVYVELPEIDLEVNAGDTLGAVESVKSASDILSPVSGTVVEANTVLAEKPGTINKGPEGEGWFAKIKLSKVEEIETLMDKEKYDKFVEE